MSQGLEYLYVHLPFCEVICHYCDFYTVRAKDARHEEFFTALRAEASTQLPLLAPEIKAIYFGGGTPSASPPELVHSFLEIFRDRVTAETEITLEANPTNISPAIVASWKAAGINRISLGIQSLDDKILKRLGRVHSGKQAIAALETCLTAFENVTGDLIYGVPEQSEEQPAQHAATMAKLGLKHISAYNLTLEPGHFLHPRLPADDFSWKQIRKLAETLEARGFSHYEISNFAVPGFESRNNMNYWKGGGYLALGPSAHGFDGEYTRWHNVADWEEYVKRALV
ncbi:MAG: radical SAM family heme chaperone HemW, partial [Bdellovibrionota bacterium]